MQTISDEARDTANYRTDWSQLPDYEYWERRNKLPPAAAWAEVMACRRFFDVPTGPLDRNERIYRLRCEKRMTYRDIGKLFGIHGSRASHIWKREYRRPRPTGS